MKFRKVFVALILLLTGIFPVMTNNIVYADDEDNSLCFIQDARINQITDGTAPFDASSGKGNDTSGDNQIVRTFDYINYNIEYTTGLADITQTVDSANIRIESVLNYSPKQVEFNTDTLSWCLDRTITYYYSDGSFSTNYDSSKDVIKQVLTGYRRLENSSEVNNIPGTGTLILGLYVKAAQNGDIINPQTTLWVEGNSEEKKVSLDIPDVIVSAAPKYNVELRLSGGTNYLGYFNLDDGNASSTKKDGYVRGRLESYSVTLQLYNDSAEKGLKGLEFPQGDITYDLTINSIYDGNDMTNDPDYKPYLWDYIENSSSYRTGKLGRTFAPSGTSNYAWYGPYNKGTGTHSSYNGGSISMEYDDNQSNLYHFTVSDYEFDYDNLHFPERYAYSNEGNVTYTDNIASFSCGNIILLATFPEEVDTTQTLTLRAEIDNFKANAISGDVITDEVRASDNTVQTNITLYPRGSITRYQRYYGATTGYLSSTYYSGDNVIYKGNRCRIMSFIHGYGEYSWTGFNLLQKFDDEALEIYDGNYTISYSGVIEKGTNRMLFAAKPDKSGWNDDDEMERTVEEQLIFFENIDDLKNAGYTCVGVLYELRGIETSSRSTSSDYVNMLVNMKVKDDAISGNVYQTVSDLRAWNENGREMTFSWLDYSYDDSIKAYGNGGNDIDGTYVGGYTNPMVRTTTNYTKVWYEDGVMHGHTGGYNNGNSLLILGYKAGVNLEIADKTQTSNGSSVPKTVYDLDNGERTVTYKITPSLTSDSSGNNQEGSDASEYYTELTVTATVPVGLTYDSGSASITPDSVVNNDDGTQTITWVLKNQKVGATLESFTFTCTIGQAGTADDVSNGQSFMMKTGISGTEDTRAQTAANGNYDEVSMSVIRLASTSVSKRAVEPLVELGQDIEYDLFYSNTSATDIYTSKVADILPYNEDGRGTDFGGNYTVKKVEIDYSDAQASYNHNDVILAYSNTTYNVNDVQSITMLDSNSLPDNWHTVSQTTNENNVITFDNLNVEARALYMDIGFVAGNSYLKITVTLAPKDNSNADRQQAGDMYVNSFAQNSKEQASIVYSNTASVQVVKRDISGVAWTETNIDGIRTDNESFMENVTVSLYRTDRSEFSDNDDGITFTTDSGNVTLYKAYDVFGNQIESKTTNSKGEYLFENLESGTYYIDFTEIDKLAAVTDKNQGTSTDIDSDAISVENSNSTINHAYIENIELPDASDMLDFNFVSEHNDIGVYYRLGSITINKLDKDKNVLPGVNYALYTSDESMKNDDIYEYNGITYYKLEEQTTNNNGNAIFDDIAGDGVIKYIIIETSTVEGQSLLEDVIDVGALPAKIRSSQLNDNYKGQYFIEGDYAYCYDLTFEITDGVLFTVPKTGGINTGTVIVCAGLVLALVSIYYLKKQKSKTIKTQI